MNYLVKNCTKKQLVAFNKFVEKYIPSELYIQRLYDSSIWFGGVDNASMDYQRIIIGASVNQTANTHEVVSFDKLMSIMAKKFKPKPPTFEEFVKEFDTSKYVSVFKDKHGVKHLLKEIVNSDSYPILLRNTNYNVNNLRYDYFIKNFWKGKFDVQKIEL